MLSTLRCGCLTADLTLLVFRDVLVDLASSHSYTSYLIWVARISFIEFPMKSVGFCQVEGGRPFILFGRCFLLKQKITLPMISKYLYPYPNALD